MTDNATSSDRPRALTPDAFGFLCGCLGTLACGGAGACFMLFRVLLQPGATAGASALAGLLSMALALVFLPGIAAGAPRRPIPLLACGAFALACLVPEVFVPDGVVESAIFLFLYGAALAGMFTLNGKIRSRPEHALSLRPMAVWSLVLAVSFVLLASSMLLDAAVSERVTVGGKSVAYVAVFAAFGAFFGLIRPGLFTPVVYLGLVLVWLLIPVAGLEAYMYTEGISRHSEYAASGWRWSFAFCIISGIAALRLLVLRQDLILKKSFFADWT